MTPLTMDQLVTLVKSGVEDIGRDFTKPDDDWSQTAFIYSPKDGGDLAVAALMLDNTQQVTSAICKMIEEFDASMVALVSSTWFVDVSEVPEDERHLYMPPHYMQPSKSPYRREQVVITATDREVTDMHYALIERHEDGPPTLGEWQVFQDGRAGARLEGDLVDPIKDALR